MHNFHQKAIFLLFLVGIIVYANCLLNPFIWDDSALAKDNFLIRDWRYIGRIFTTNLFHSSGGQSTFYRPLQSLSYMFDYWLWKHNPFGYHLTNIILHISVATLAYMLFVLITEQKTTSLITALLFVVHPIHTEAVTYISGRADSLMGLFLLAAFILFIKHLRQTSAHGRYLYLGSLACFLLSLFCKETSLIFPFALLLTRLKIIRKESQVKFYAYLPFFIIALAYVLLRFTLSEIPLNSFLVSGYSFNVRLLIFFKVVAIYLGLLIMPANLHMSRNIYLPQSLFVLPIFFSFLLFILILLFAWRSYRRSPLVFLGLAWFFIFLLPQSGFFPINAFLAEHFLYLPSLGFFFLISYSLWKISPRKIFIALIILILCFYAVFTVNRNLEWKDPLKFYEKLVRLSPSSFAGHNNLGLEYEKKGLYERAIRQYQIALALKQDFLEASANMARSYYKNGQQEEAIRQYLELIKRKPDCDFALAGLADIYAEDKQYEKARESIRRYKQAIGSSPQRPQFYNKLGLIYNELGELDLAIEEFKKAIEIDNHDPILHNNLGVVYKKKDWLELAVAEYYKAIKIMPDLAEAYTNLGILFSKVGRYDLAEENLKLAIRLDPDSSQAHYNLGVVYWHKSQWDKSKSQWEKALELEPEHQLAEEWLQRIAKKNE